MEAGRTFPRWLFVATAIASLATVAGPYLMFGLTETGFQLAARYTVRVSFPLFLLAYIARPLAHTWRHEVSRWLLRNRRYLGLSFALAHTVHLGALTAFFVFIDQVPSIETLIGGGGAYLAMFAMAATSNNVSAKKLGASWRRLHLFGMHYLWIIFAFSYLGRWTGDRGDGAGEDMVLVGMIGTSLCVAALLLRLFAYWKRRGQR
ncbi:MAG: hypothetical protein RLN89_01600 [Parvibaculum sp.]